MTWGWHVWVTRSATVPCTLLTLLAACTPTARPPSGAVVATGAPPLGAAAGPIESGRSYAFGQMLAREQERSAALQQQLEERGRQIEQLQAEVQQLHQQEGELRAALERGAADGGVAAAAQPAPELAPQPASAEAAPVSTPQPQKEEEQPEEATAGSALPDEKAPTDEATAAAEERGEPVVVASLRAALVQEQERRQAAETELERLKEETSTPALAEPGDPAAELAATRAEVGELRDALAAERVERERMADDLRVLQQTPPQAPENDAAQQAERTPEDAELHARIEALTTEKDAIVESFNRSLAASEQRTKELEEQLAAAQAAPAATVEPTNAPAPDGEAGAVRDENAALRARLDEEHRRTEELAAKLRVATRVTDLIFKMQAQQAQDQPGRSR